MFSFLFVSRYVVKLQIPVVPGNKTPSASSNKYMARHKAANSDDKSNPRDTSTSRVMSDARAWPLSSCLSPHSPVAMPARTRIAAGADTGQIVTGRHLLSLSPTAGAATESGDMQSDDMQSDDMQSDDMHPRDMHATCDTHPTLAPPHPEPPPSQGHNVYDTTYTGCGEADRGDCHPSTACAALQTGDTGRASPAVDSQAHQVETCVAPQTAPPRCLDAAELQRTNDEAQDAHAAPPHGRASIQDDMHVQHHTDDMHVQHHTHDMYVQHHTHEMYVQHHMCNNDDKESMHHQEDTSIDHDTDRSRHDNTDTSMDDDWDTLINDVSHNKDTSIDENKDTSIYENKDVSMDRDKDRSMDDDVHTPMDDDNTHTLMDDDKSTLINNMCYNNDTSMHHDKDVSMDDDDMSISTCRISILAAACTKYAARVGSLNAQVVALRSMARPPAQVLLHVLFFLLLKMF